MQTEANKLANSLNTQQAIEMARSYNVLANFPKLQSLLTSIFSDTDFSHYTKYQLHQIINDAVLSHYRGEIYIKHLLVNHFIQRNAIAAFEIKTYESRLDFLRINGASISYEIKSEVDSLQKLPRQTKDYSNLFEYNFLVLDNIHLKKARKMIPDNYGIIVAENDQLTIKRQAKKQNQFSAEKQLALFTQKELHKYFKTNKTEILKKFPKKTINEVFKQMLKDRYAPKWEFLKKNWEAILPIDYQYFFHHNIAPSLIYRKG